MISCGLKGTFDLNRLNLELGQAIEQCRFADDLEEIMVSVKLDYSKGTRKLISLAELSYKA